MCCFRFLGSHLKQCSIQSLFELSSEMYLMYCFRFLCSQQRLSSIRSLLYLSSSELYVLFQVPRQSTEIVLDLVAV